MNALKLAASAHPTSAEKEPVQRDIFLGSEGQEKVRVGCGSILVTIHVLLEYSQFTRELTLRSVASNLCDSFRELLLQSSYRCPAHFDFPSRAVFSCSKSVRAELFP